MAVTVHTGYAQISQNLNNISIGQIHIVESVPEAEPVYGKYHTLQQLLTAAVEVLLCNPSSWKGLLWSGHPEGTFFFYSQR